MAAHGRGGLTGSDGQGLSQGLSQGFASTTSGSGFSYGFGVATPTELATAAAELGMEALALTDRDGLYGIPRFFEAAAGAGVYPVVGVEISVAEPGNPAGTSGPPRRRHGRVPLLCRLITRYRCGSEDRRRPLCPFTVLLEHPEGLVCLTGAVPFGYVPRLALSGREGRADRALRELREAFGEDLYVELTDDRTAGSRRRMGRRELARRHGLPVLATNEVAYLGPEDHKLHDVVVATSNPEGSPRPRLPDNRPALPQVAGTGGEVVPRSP